MTTAQHPFVNTYEQPAKEDDLLEIWTRKDISDSQVTNEIEQEINFLIPKCHACKDEVKFTEGDVIFGDKWYHKACWKESQEIELLFQ